MTESIVILRLARNLRYKITYIKIFETFLEDEPGPDVAELFRELIKAQQNAVAPLASYLRRLGESPQEAGLDEKLMGHALKRKDVASRLRFIHDGMQRSVSWYKMQVMDKQMTRDPELFRLLLELGELDAAKLWRAEAVMGLLKISVKAKEKDWSDQPAPAQEPVRDEAWRPRLLDDFGSKWEDRSASRSGSPRSRPREW
jgi:hypothetical protein